MDWKQQMRALATRSREAARALAKWDTTSKNAALLAMAAGIEQAAATIKVANAKDVEAGRRAGLSAAVLDRLTLTDQRIAAVAQAVREIVALPDPVGQVRREWTAPNGMRMQKVSVPLGVILMIYEARPNVTVDAAALCVKSGNAVILRGGSEALHSNLALAEAMRPSLPADAVTVVPTTDRVAVDELLKLDDLINLCIPRGGESLIRAVVEKSRLPVIKHYKGVCHVFVDRDADLDMAEKIVINAKCQRPATCNALETLLVDEPVAAKFLPRIVRTLRSRRVELRVEERAQQYVIDGSIPLAEIRLATEEDWSAEYLDLILAIRVVAGLDEAIEHIAKYGSAHSDAIVTRNRDTAEQFLREVDSSSVFWNASTRLADGGVYGFGAEIGISTDKLHARGPMGLEDLTSYKYVVVGDGHIRE